MCGLRKPPESLLASLDNASGCAGSGPIDRMEGASTTLERLDGKHDALTSRLSSNSIKHRLHLRWKGEIPHKEKVSSIPTLGRYMVTDTNTRMLPCSVGVGLP